MKYHRRLLNLIPMLLTACVPLTGPMATFRDSVSVSLHGMNYTDRTFSYVLVDPKDAKNTGGGELVNPFSAGGIMCCYSLPRQWVPGIKIEVHTTSWEPKDANGKLLEIKQVHTVEVPKYVNGEVGELWVLRTKEGAIELVSSNAQPDHPAWPGRVKGWPEPSVEYQRERWQLYLKLAEGSVKNYQDLMEKLQNEPKKQIFRAWEYAKKYSPEEIKDFIGPEDPGYAAYLKNRYAQGLSRNEAKLIKLLRERP